MVLPGLRLNSEGGESSATTLRLAFLSCIPSDQSPDNDAQQRTGERRDQVLKRNLDLAKTQVDVKQPE